MEDAIICYNEALKADPSFFEAYESTYVWLLRLRLYSMESNRVNYWLLIEYWEPQCKSQLLILKEFSQSETVGLASSWHSRNPLICFLY